MGELSRCILSALLDLLLDSRLLAPALQVAELTVLRRVLALLRGVVRVAGVALLAGGRREVEPVTRLSRRLPELGPDLADAEVAAEEVDQAGGEEGGAERAQREHHHLGQGRRGLDQGGEDGRGRCGQRQERGGDPDETHGGGY